MSQTAFASKIKVDTLRANEYQKKLADRLAEVSNFIYDKTLKLNSNLEAIQLFVESANCKDLEIGNMYSTGFSGDEYNTNCSMIAHCTMTSRKLIGNKDLAAKRLQEKWDALVTDISSSFMAYQIKDTPVTFDSTTIKFQIWI